jgi:hypothetical protein
MRMQALALGVAIGCALWPAASRAQPRPVAAGTVVLVMESGGGVSAGVALRDALNRELHVHVVSLADATKQHVRASAMLTVATDASRSLNVVYWDLRGSSDALSAPTPAVPEQRAIVALALASALLDKHRAELTVRALEAEDASGMVDVIRSPRALYALLERVGWFVPRTSVQLHIEDF